MSHSVEEEDRERYLEVKDQLEVLRAQLQEALKRVEYTLNEVL